MTHSCSCEGRWQGSKAAGSSYQNFLENPQFVLASKVDTSVSIFVFQAKAELDKIGFFVLKNFGTGRLVKYISTDLIAESGFVDNKKASKSIQIKAGESYTVIPCCFTPFQESTFTLTAFSSAEVRLYAAEEGPVEEDTKKAPIRKSQSRPALGNPGLAKAQQQSMVITPSLPAHNLASIPQSKSFANYGGDKPLELPKGAVTEKMQSQWTATSAGGCVMSPSWRINPQFCFSLSVESPVRISLAQDTSGRKRFHSIGFYVAEAQGNGAERVSLGPSSILTKAPFEEQASVSCIYTCKPNVLYVIIPCTFKSGLEGAFTLSVSAGCRSNLTPLQKTWSEFSITAAWAKHNAGGCRNNPSFGINDQYLLSLPTSVKNAVLVLSQVGGEPTGKGMYAILANGSNSKVSSVRKSDILVSTPFRRDEEVSCDLEHDGKSIYNIIPCTFEPGVFLSYKITIFTDSPLTTNPITLISPALAPIAVERNRRSGSRAAKKSPKGSPKNSPMKTGANINGKWNHVTSGGRMKYSSWRMNPHFLMVSSGTGKVTLTLEHVMQGTIKAKAAVLKIGFYVITAGETGKRRILVDKTSLLAESPFSAQGAVSCSLDVTAGSKYYVVPCTFHPGAAGHFSLNASRSDISFSLPSEDWHQYSLEGEWNDDTAGGSKFNESWIDNPNFCFSSSCRNDVTIILSQEQETDEAASFMILKGDSNHTIPTKTQIAFESNYQRSEVCQNLDVPPGRYTIIPSLLEPGVNGVFKVLFYAEKPIDLFEPSSANKTQWLDQFPVGGTIRKRERKPITAANLQDAEAAFAAASKVDQHQKQGTVKGGAAKYNTIRLKTLKKEEEPKVQPEKQKVVRKAISTEILTTERSYCSGLQTAIEFYFEPLLNKFSPATNKLSTTEVATIFGNIKQLYQVQQKLLALLEADIASFNPDTTMISASFLAIVPELVNVYVPYVCNYNKSMSVMDKCEKSKQTTKFLESCRQESKKQLNLADFLIMPIQRVPRYVLLLQELSKNTPRDHPDREDLLMALSKIKEVAADINEQKKASENNLRLNVLQTIIHGKIPDGSAIVTPNRSYIREGPFKVVDGGKEVKMYCFLCNDLLMVTKPDKGKKGAHALKHWVSLPPAHPINQCQEGFFMEGLLFIAPTNDAKISWITDIKGVIDSAKSSQSTISL